MSLVELERVHYRYEGAAAEALAGVSLTMDTGEYILLAGASGSGKSSLCRLLDGLIPHFYEGELTGRVCVDGMDTSEHPVHDLFSHVGLVFQNPAAQLFNSTVTREVAFGLESLGLPRHEIHERTDWALAATGIAPLRHHSPQALSGGEQQRVAIASILALRPQVLVLDEPFSNLDPQGIAELRLLLNEMRARGITILVAEHRLGASLADATRLVILDHGRVARDGPPSAILQEDVTQFSLNMPFVVRLARRSGWDTIPLSVDQAIALAHARAHVVMPNNHHADFNPPPDAPAVVEMRSVSYEWQAQPVLHNLNLTIRRGECVALVGRNGSGKTTLLKQINGIYRPTAGNVTVLGQDTRRFSVSEIAWHVGSVFQNPNSQLFKPNVREEIEVGPRALKRLDPAWMDQLIAMFGLEPFLDRSPFALSEGEKKRVTFASAMASHPEIVLLDEPTTGQDYAFRSALERLLRELREQGVTVLLATHDLEFAEQASDRWVVLAGGTIASDGSPDTVMHNKALMERAALRPTARYVFQQHWASLGRLPLHQTDVEHR